MSSLNYWRDSEAPISLKLSLIIKVIDVMDDYYKMSIIAEWSIWMITFALDDSIIYLTFFTTHTEPAISSFVG